MSACCGFLLGCVVIRKIVKVQRSHRPFGGLTCSGIFFGKGHRRKKENTPLFQAGCFASGSRAILGRSGLEREDYVATDGCLAACVVFVEAVAVLVPNPANFWSEQEIRVSSVVHTGGEVVEVIVLDTTEA
jgi:hypothetical protein